MRASAPHPQRGAGFASRGIASATLVEYDVGQGLLGHVCSSVPTRLVLVQPPAAPAAAAAAAHARTHTHTHTHTRLQEIDGRATRSSLLVVRAPHTPPNSVPNGANNDRQRHNERCGGVDWWWTAAKNHASCAVGGADNTLFTGFLCDALAGLSVELGLDGLASHGVKLGPDAFAGLSVELGLRRGR